MMVAMDDIYQHVLPCVSFKSRRIPCTTHIINLIVQSFLFDTDPQAVNVDKFNPQASLEVQSGDLAKWRKHGPLGKLHNIVTYIRRTPQRLKRFKSFSGNLSLRQDNATRWNSLYVMLEWLLRKYIQRPIRDFCQQEEELEADLLSHSEWKLLGQIKGFLEEIYDATKAVEGSDKTIEEVIPVIDFLFKTFERGEAEFEHDERMGIMLTTGWAKLKKYYNQTDENPVFVAALVLNPVVKCSYIEREWEPEWIANAKKRVEEFWVKEYKSKATVLPQTPTLNATLSSKERPNRFTHWKSQMQPSTSSLDEYNKYIASPPVLPILGMNSQEWWIRPAQRELHPSLSLMAIGLLSIPASSSETERLFSGVRQTITATRGVLQEPAINALECLKSWFRVDGKEREGVENACRGEDTNGAV